MSREIPLTRGAVALVDDDDYDYLAQWCWRLNSHGYAIRSFKLDGKNRYLNMHRIVVDAQPGQYVDHIDHNRLNNTRANLRFVTRQQNQRHRRQFRNNRTGFKGVSYLHNQWHARLGLDGRMVHLGFFDDPEVAAQVYDAAARRVFGEFTIPNLPDHPTPPEIEELVTEVLERRGR